MIDNLLSRLDKVRRTGRDRWIACCPAHGDKHPSLTIRELENGLFVIHCQSQQCGAAETDVFMAQRAGGAAQ